MAAHDDYALERARMLLGSYRIVHAQDPRKYLMALGIVLALFPDPVIAEATSPMTGIQTVIGWPPSAAELRAYCDAILLRHRHIAHQDLPPGFDPPPYSRHYPHRDEYFPSPADRERVAAALARFKRSIKPPEESRPIPWTAPTDEQLYARYGRRPVTEPVPFD